MSGIQFKITRHTKKWDQGEKETIETDSQMIQWRGNKETGQEENISNHVYIQKGKLKNEVDLPLPEKLRFGRYYGQGAT